MKQMKKEYKRRFPGLSVAALRSKLISTVALLLVASSLLVTSSYAWFVLSTAPEVTGIQTQVGANGSLEVALLSTETWDHLDRLDLADIDESADENIGDANLTWGNLVNLADPAYGLGLIALNPSRLYIEPDGEGYKINSTILKTPVYAEDGRVKSLDKTSAVSYIYSGNGFSREGYGVRAIGINASMSAFQSGSQTSRSEMRTHQSAARTAASIVLNDRGGDLANMVVKYTLTNQTTGYTDADIQAVKSLAEGLQGALDEIELALRHTFAGYIATEAADIAAENYEAARDEALSDEMTLADLLSLYPGISSVIPNFQSYVSLLTTDQQTITTAIQTCDVKMAEKDSFTWSEISEIVLPLMDTDKLLVLGKEIDELKNEVMPGGNLDLNAALGLVAANKGVTITVPSGSGVLSDIADFADDYSAKVTVNDIPFGEQNMNVDVAMNTATEMSTVYISACYRALASSQVNPSAGSSTMINDFYGYAVDLAFRTNAEESNLLLQTEPENRVYEGSTENANLQGGGSYMTFHTDANLSATKMVKLMRGIRVVFMDQDQKVIAIAALNCTLGKDAYTEMEQAEKIETGMFAYLTGIGEPQISDRIDYDSYSHLPDESAVTFNADAGTVSAKLYLYGYSMPSGGGTGNGGKSGALALSDEPLASNVIMPLQQDIPQRLTAVVYIDGSYVTNATVAADAARSMTGTLNLQFSSDALLMPAENSALRSGSEDETETPLPQSLAEGGNLDLSALAAATFGDSEVTWTSLDEGIATVSGGVVTGISEGETTIRISGMIDDLPAALDVPIVVTASESSGS